jgi:hypothetical protein
VIGSLVSVLALGPIHAGDAGAAVHVPGEPQQEPPPIAALADQVEAALARIGSETETERAVKRIIPWIASVGLHGGMVVLGFLLTWTVVLFRDEAPPPVIVADFEDVRYAPVSRLKRDSLETLQEPVVDPSPIEPVELQPLDFELDPIDLLAAGADRSPVTRFAPEANRDAASFIGLSTSNTRRIVYVIDASGSMIRSFPVVVAELARSLDALTARQSFSVVFFQRNDALVVPPGDKLLDGTQAEKARVLDWIKANVIPSGRSNPLQALERALKLEPDVIFLLSENITGSGEFEIDQVDLLSMLDELNPRDANDRRRTAIHCVQFLDPDPLGTLERIAADHGGPGAYKFLDRGELGMRGP